MKNQFNYCQICKNLLKDLPQKQKEVILRRFALQAVASGEGGVKGETLESIGRDYGITRERIRQIERDGILRLEPEIKQYQKVFQHFREYLQNKGNLKREDILLEELGGQRLKPQIYFLLTLGKNFERIGETEELYSLWTLNKNSLFLAQKVINSFYHKLETEKKPLSPKDFNSSYSLPQATLISYLEISKKIQQNSEGLFGLKNWPEINPRGVKDRAYLVFKKEKKPLHFAEVSKLIEGSLVQTVHNELIKDPRFVLVGRGIYALEEWGYFPGQVKDVILKILKEERKPLTKEEILEKVRKQRLVKENTVFLNLSDKKHFLRNPQGKYEVKEI